MYIHEAVAEAVKIGGYIVHPDLRPYLHIKPTNTPDCCVIYAEGKAPGPRWNPVAEDLVRDDWTVVKKGST